MNMAIVPQEQWEEIAESVKEIKDILAEKKQNEHSSEWLQSAEARKLVGVSGRTWQRYRDLRLIPFTQIGRKIMLKRGDVENFLNSHQIGGKGATR